MNLLALLTVASAASLPTQKAATPGKAAAKNGLFQEYSSEVMSLAMAIRTPGVAPSEATSVASVIASKGMDPAQFTHLAQLGKEILANEKSINPTSLLEAANLMASAYTSMHTQASYSNYVEYVKQHSSIFDVEKLRGAGSSNQQKERMGEMQLVAMYESLMSNNNGRNAIRTMTEVMENYARDFNVKLPGVWLSQLIFDMI